MAFLRTCNCSVSSFEDGRPSTKKTQPQVQDTMTCIDARRSTESCQFC